MNLRKYFNHPNASQKKMISDGADMLISLANERSAELNRQKSASVKNHNSICPMCKKSSIVNKIAQVQGSGSVSGSFGPFGGGLYGSSSIDTNEVNHCNDCGNQWKKEKMKYIWEMAVVSTWIDDINTSQDKEYEFAKRTLKMLKEKEIPAESIWKLFIMESVYDRCYYSTREELTLGYLREHFKSVYDC